MKRYHNEVAELLHDLSEDVCEVEIRLDSGADCCKLKGRICGLKRNGRILVLTEKDRKCYIPVDKIAAICQVCKDKRFYR